VTDDNDDLINLGNIEDAPERTPGPQDIVFTQYLRPHGRPVRVWVTRPAPVVAQALRLQALGYHFDIEELMNGTVSMTVERGGDDLPLAIELCPNGPAVLAAVDRLMAAAILRTEAPE
jgi:hypothetical protein